MRKAIFVLFMFLLLFVVYGCTLPSDETPSGENPSVVVLNAPTNVSITDGILSWDPVDQAVSYRVVVGTQNFTTTQTSYDLKTISNLALGSHQVSVIAVGATSVSPPSATLTYTLSTTVTLGAPQELTLNNGQLSWQPVSGATYYTVHMGLLEIKVTTHTYDVSQMTIPAGTHQIFVKAYNQEESSPKSLPLSMTLETDQFSTHLSSLLTSTQANYAPDMKLEDFAGDIHMFTQYLEDNHIIASFLKHAFLAGISDDLSNAAYLLLSDFYLEDITSAMAQLKSMKALGISAAQWSDLLIRMSYEMSYMDIFGLQRNIHMTHEDMLDYQAYIDGLKDDEDYIYWNTLFETYLSPADLILLDRFFDHDLPNYGAHESLHSIFFGNVIYYFQMSYNPYEYSDDVIHDLLYRWLITLADHDIEIVMYPWETDYRSLYVFDMFQYETETLDYYNKTLLNYQQQIEEIILSYEVQFTHHEAYVIAAETIIDYLWLIESTLPAHWMTLADEMIEDKAFTPEELAIIKTELIQTLKLTLPSLSDFEILNDALYTFIGSNLDELQSSREDVVKDMALLQRTSIDVLLSFMGWITEEDLEIIFDQVVLIADDIDYYSMSLFGSLALYGHFYPIIEITDAFNASHDDLLKSLNPLVTNTLIEALMEINLLRYRQTLNPEGYYDALRITRIDYLLEHLEFFSAFYQHSKVLMNDLTETLFEGSPSMYEQFLDLFETDELSSEDIEILIGFLYEFFDQVTVTQEMILSFTRIFHALAVSLDSDVNDLESVFYSEAIYTTYLMIRDMVDYFEPSDFIEAIELYQSMFTTHQETYMRSIYGEVCDEYGCYWSHIGYEEAIYEYTSLTPEGLKNFIDFAVEHLNAFTNAHPVHQDNFYELLSHEGLKSLYQHNIQSNLYYRYPSEIKTERILDHLNQHADEHLVLLQKMFLAFMDAMLIYESTDGAIYDHLMWFYEVDVYTSSMSDFIENLLPYVDILLDHMDEEALGGLFRFITFTTVMNNSYYATEEDLIEMIDMFESWYTPGDLILADFHSILEALQVYLKEDLLFDMIDHDEFTDQSMILFFVHNLKHFMTSDIEQDIKAIIEDVFEDVVRLETTKEYLRLNDQDITELYNELMEVIDLYILLFDELLDAYDLDTFESKYFVDYVLNTMHSVFAISEFELNDLGFVESEELILLSITRYHHYQFAFTPEETAYYRLKKLTYSSVYLSVYDALTHEMILKETYAYGLTFPSLELIEGKTYYFIIHAYQNIGDMEMMIEQLDSTGRTENNPIILTGSMLYTFEELPYEEYFYLEFEATEDAEYLLRFTSNDYFWIEMVIETDTSFDHLIFWHIESHMISFEAGQTYRIRVQNFYSNAYQVTFVFSKLFQNSVETAIEIEPDMPLNTFELGMFYELWLSFDVTIDNSYLLELAGYGYIIVYVYDHEMNFWNYSWYYMDNSYQTIYLPSKGYIEILLGYRSGLHTLQLSTFENTLSYHLIELDETLHYAIDLPDEKVYNHVFIAPESGVYEIEFDFDDFAIITLINFTQNHSYSNWFYEDSTKIMTVHLEQNDTLFIETYLGVSYMYQISISKLMSEPE